MCVCVCVYTNIPNRQMFKGISCGKIRLVTRVGVAVCSVRDLHIHLFCLSQMQMYVKKYYGATFLHKSSVFVVVNDNAARFLMRGSCLRGRDGYVEQRIQKRERPALEVFQDGTRNLSFKKFKANPLLSARPLFLSG